MTPRQEYELYLDYGIKLKNDKKILGGKDVHER